MSVKPELKCVAGTHMGEQPRVGGVALPGAVKKLEQVVLREMRDLIVEMFGRADDLFFDFAEKVKSDVERNRYFDAMRELRLQRKGIAQKFLQEIANQFAQLPDPAARLNSDGGMYGGADALSLVNHDELEQSVAVEGMVNKARARHADGLYLFAARIDALVMSVEISERNSPLDPRQLSGAFVEALKGFGCDIKSRLIVLKLFEQGVLEKLDKPLENCNYLLAKAGILPDLKSPSGQASRSENNKPAAANTASIPAGVAADPSSQLLALLSAIRQAPVVPGVAYSPAMMGQPIGSVSAQAREIGQGQLMSVLTEMQQVIPRGHDVLNVQGPLPQLPLRDALQSLFANRETRFGPERVSQLDADVINLVGMLFDCILDDRSLPLRVKALIGRLQIPMLKVAVKDPSFFSAAGHPARRLLNELARAGIGLPDKVDDLARDSVFTRIRETVQAVLDGFNDDLTLFQRLHDDFVDKVSVEQRRAELVEQRIRSAEEGKALTEQARGVVAQAIEQRLGDRVLPEVLIRFVDEAWQNVMFRIFLRDGEASKAWVSALQTLDVLLKSVTPPLRDDDRKAAFANLPKLQKLLRDGLESISFNAFSANEYILRLEEIQHQVLREPSLRANEEPESQLLAAVRDSMDEAERTAAPTSFSSRFMAPRVTRIDTARNANVPAVEELVLPPMAEDDEHLFSARHLGVGAWVEFIEADGSKLRCKLAARIKATDRMVFVNRSGMKVKDCSTLAVAYELAHCRMVVLDDSLLFDRALQSVIGSLRRVRDQSAVG